MFSPRMDPENGTLVVGGSMALPVGEIEITIEITKDDYPQIMGQLGAVAMGGDKCLK